MKKYNFLEQTKHTRFAYKEPLKRYIILNDAVFAEVLSYANNVNVDLILFACTLNNSFVPNLKNPQIYKDLALIYYNASYFIYHAGDNIINAQAFTVIEKHELFKVGHGIY